MTRRWSTTVPTLDDLEDDRLIQVVCVPGKPDCIQDASLLMDHTQCFIKKEDC